MREFMFPSSSKSLGYPVQIPCFMLLYITQATNSHIHSREIIAVPATITSEFQDSGNSKVKYKADTSIKHATITQKLPANSAQQLPVISHRSEVHLMSSDGTGKCSF